MKFDYFLIAFIFVIILEDVELYKFQVFITNLYIKQAKQRGLLAEAIENFIQCPNTSMEELSLIFAVPDKRDYLRHPQLCVDRETRVGNSIYAVLHEFNLLENENLSTEQIVALASNVPNVDEEHTAYSLSELALNRRRETRDSIRYLVRITMGPGGVTIGNIMCRSIGLLRSILQPDLFITNAVIEGFGICVLTTTTDHNRVWKYGFVNGTIFQLSSPREPLANQMVWDN